jgi:hypothetical protein
MDFGRLLAIDLFKTLVVPFMKDVIEFKNTTGIYVKGTNCNSIFGTEPFITPVVVVLLDAN